MFLLIGLGNTMSTFLPVDFNKESIKDDLIKAFKSNDTFKDYNFEGSNLSTIMDLLSQNTQYNAFLANMQTNESFLDTAQIRTNVVSGAKRSSYVPKSTQAPVATIRVLVTPSGNALSNSIVMKEGTKFLSIIDNIVYDFVTTTAYSAVLVDGVYVFDDVSIYQGSFYTYEYDVLNSRDDFIIPNAGVDIDTLVVSVQSSDIDTTTTIFNRADGILAVTDKSLVYFMKETEGEKFGFSMGDGVLGKQLTVGNIIKIKYLVTAGSVANYANDFDSVGVIGGYPNVSVDTISSAAGGSEIESIASIKNNAPKSNRSKKRAVIAEDYEWLAPQILSTVKSVKSWGGEDNIPAAPGFVFLSLNPTDGFIVSDTEKMLLLNAMSDKNVGSVKIKIVDPEFTYLRLVVKYVYSTTSLNKPLAQLTESVKATIKEYSDINLSEYSAPYANSVLTTKIDNTDFAIINSVVSVTAIKKITPILNKHIDYYIDFYNEVNPNTLLISGFRTDDVLANTNIHYIKDDGRGTLNVYKSEASNDVLIMSDVGSIDYLSGSIRINSFNFIDSDSLLLDVQVEPNEQTMSAERNNILVILDDISFETVSS